jgi:hypothetical protein
MENIKILIGCEESQVVCKAFRNLGYEAYSNDIQDCSGGHPEWHLKMDVFEAIRLIRPTLAIFHPPCTLMSKAGARWMYPKAGELDHVRYAEAMKAKDFFLDLLCRRDISYIAVENPLPLKIIRLPKPTQIIQPYEYGHSYSKKTLLWLKNLPELEPTNIIKEFTPYLPSNTGGASRGQKHSRGISKNAKESSKTFEGIADAMAKQWGDFIAKQL